MPVASSQLRRSQSQRRRTSLPALATGNWHHPLRGYPATAFGEPSMAPVLTELCPRSVAAAMEANRCVLGRALGQSPLAVLDEAPGLLAYRTGIPHPLFNSVLSADLKIEEADRRRMQRAAG